VRILIATTIVLFLAAGNSFAESCRSKLLGRLDSKSHFLSSEQLDRIKSEQGTPAFARSVIAILTKKLDCEEESITFHTGERSNACKSIINGKPHSRVCLIESEEGYFLVTVDMMENAHVLFGRWD
jgi:hypothetical protein